MWEIFDNLYPEITADKASVKKAKKAMLMEEAKESVNILSWDSRIPFVLGTADDAADIKRYAVICQQKNLVHYIYIYWFVVREINN